MSFLLIQTFNQNCVFLAERSHCLQTETHMDCIIFISASFVTFFAFSKSGRSQILMATPAGDAAGCFTVATTRRKMHGSFFKLQNFLA